VLCLLSLSTLVLTAAFADDWEANSKATNARLAGHSNWDLTLMRDGIYARHGRPFDNQYIRNVFNSTGWYSPDSSYSDRRLNSVEQYNVAFILKYQNSHFGSAATKPSGGGGNTSSGGSSGGKSSGYINSGTATHYLHGGEVYGFSNWQLTLMRNEIYARHGRSFDNKYIRAYFNSKSWYHPSSSYSDSRLNKYERVNADFIKGWQTDNFGTPATQP
jgi:hypothetical protein